VAIWLEAKNYIIHYKWENPGEILEAFLKQYYRDKEFIPPDIILSDVINDTQLISAWLTGKTGKKISISVPARGDKKKLVNMAMINAKTILLKRQKIDHSATLDETKFVLKLKRRPHT